jgi:AAA15 family ATPase/GTPase
MFTRRPRRLYPVGQYHWLQDFPLKLQEKYPTSGSEITLEFLLSSEEIAEFQQHIGSRLNGTLPVSFVLCKETSSIRIAKQGKGQKTLNAKASRIADFISRKMDVQYIPAVRTAEFARNIVDNLVRQELAKVEHDTKYKQALADIAIAQEPVLRALSDDITATMREFLPNIAHAKIVIEDARRSYALLEISELLVNDGVETPLESKGDGVQSLAALALMRHASRAADESKEVLIALEEPESHLHPTAIRQLKNVLMELASRYQVVITTHNPIFTNRNDVKQNIIVNKNKAFPAKNVKEVRDALGVRLDDNLSSADTVLIVEGEEDRIAIKAILSDMSDKIANNIKSGRLGIDVLGGAANLRHRIRLHLEAVCRVHVFLDDDVEGRTAFKAAQTEGIINISGVNFTTVGGKSEAELEDLYKEEVYKPIVFSETGLQWPSNGLDVSKKWADRLRNLLRRAGKPLDDGAVQIIKLKVAQAAASRGMSALHQSKAGPVESLKNSLLEKLG